MSDLKVEIKVLKPSKENIKECERIRYDAIGQVIPEQFLTSSKCAGRLYNAEMLIFGMYLDDILAAGCYVSDSFDTLFIDHLFVKKEFQETGLYLGRQLLKHVLDNREATEKYFHFRPTKSELFYIDNKSKRTYEKMGYTIKNSEIGLMSKQLTKL
ncbi:MAG: GNAT family N-acetyltransferase [Bacilli bacterium]|nr:GNAT family N-acetyltransferase [Bacilli bacterium]